MGLHHFGFAAIGPSGELMVAVPGYFAEETPVVFAFVERSKLGRENPSKVNLRNGQILKEQLG